jgi:hypothetical protein
LTLGRGTGTAQGSIEEGIHDAAGEARSLSNAYRRLTYGIEQLSSGRLVEDSFSTVEQAESVMNRLYVKRVT